jgi:hypothetical protein
LDGFLEDPEDEDDTGSGEKTFKDLKGRVGPAGCGTIYDICLCVTHMIQDEMIKKRPFCRKYFPSKLVEGAHKMFNKTTRYTKRYELPYFIQ